MPRRAELDYQALAISLPDVARWHRQLLSRSKDTARVHLTNLLRTLHEFRRMQPAALLAMSQEELDDFMQDFVAFFQEKGLAGSTIAKYVDSIKSYLAWHRKPLGRRLYIEGADDSPKAEAQEIPAQQKLDTLLSACDLRTGTMVALEAFSSVRPQVLGRSDASDGLVLGDLPELEIGPDGVRFTKVPALVRVRKSLSKTRKAYLTFLGPQGCDILLNDLRGRMARGEVLTAKSPVVNPLDGSQRFLHRGNIQDCIRIRMRRAGLASSTYILRSYFSNRLVVAESHGVPSIYREFWMGHKGGLQTRYALQKELPADTIEDMRRAYAKALPFLETRQDGPQEDPVRRMAGAALKMGGHSDEDIAKLDLEGMDEAGVVRLMADALAKRVGVVAPAAAKPAARTRQKVVEVSELAAMLEQGWVYRASLDGGKAIIEATS
jgi:hypothetical protein